MKVIAKTGKGFIVDISNWEMDKLVKAGKAREYNREIGIGDEVRIHHLFDRLTKMDGAQSELNGAANMLRGIADAMLVVHPVIKSVTEDDEEGKETDAATK